MEEREKCYSIILAQTPHEISSYMPFEPQTPTKNSMWIYHYVIQHNPIQHVNYPTRNGPALWVMARSPNV
jgi:hypothetical protein